MEATSAGATGAPRPDIYRTQRTRRSVGEAFVKVAPRLVAFLILDGVAFALSGTTAFRVALPVAAVLTIVFLAISLLFGRETFVKVAPWLVAFLILDGVAILIGPTAIRVALLAAAVLTIVFLAISLLFGRDTAIRVALLAAALISILTTTGIVVALIEGTVDFFGEVGVGEFVAGTKWTLLVAAVLTIVFVAISLLFGKKTATRIALLAAALIAVLTTMGIVFTLFEEKVAFFGQVVAFFRDEVGVGEFFAGAKWTPLAGGESQSFGVVPLVFDTLYLTGIGLLVAIPFGIGSAIYLSEYASPRVRRTLKPILEVLSGVPTIVFGYFALLFVTPVVLKGLGLEVGAFNALSAGLVLGVLVLPTIATVADDALTAVPGSLREGAFGLGASRMQVSLRVVLPAALSGVVAALVLGASRAIGETVIILVAGGQTTNLTLDPAEAMQNMAAFIAATSRADIPTTGPETGSIFAVGMTLFGMTLVLNTIAIRFVRKYRQVYE